MQTAGLQAISAGYITAGPTNRELIRAQSAELSLRANLPPALRRYSILRFYFQLPDATSGWSTLALVAGNALPEGFEHSATADEAEAARLDGVTTDSSRQHSETSVWHVSVRRSSPFNGDRTTHPLHPRMAYHSLRENQMQCNCGGETADHVVTRDKAVIARYSRCTACGRIVWTAGEDALKAHDREAARLKSRDLFGELTHRGDAT